MRHGYKNVKFTYGQDAREMLRRKLLQNFIAHGHLTTTKPKAKFLKGTIDRVVSLAKKNTEATRNKLLSFLGDVSIVESFIKDVVPQLDGRTSGYAKSKLLARRESDGTLVVRLEWSNTVVKKEEKKVIKAKELQAAQPTEIAKPALKTTKKSVKKAASAAK